MKLIDCDINVHCLILEGFSDASRVSEFVDDGISYLEAVQYEPKFISYWKGGGDISRNAWLSKYESMKEDMHNYPSFGLYSHGIHGTRDVHCPGSIVQFIRREGHSLFNMMIYSPSYELGYETIINKYRELCKNIYIFDAMLLSNPNFYGDGIPYENSIRNYQYHDIFDRDRVGAWQEYYFHAKDPQFEIIRDIYDVQIADAQLLQTIYDAAVKSWYVKSDMIQIEYLPSNKARLTIDKSMHKAVRKIADRLGLTCAGSRNRK